MAFQSFGLLFVVWLSEAITFYTALKANSQGLLLQWGFFCSCCEGLWHGVLARRTGPDA